MVWKQQDAWKDLVSGHEKKRLGEALWANQKSPGMEIGRNLNFNDCVSLLCRKAGRKLAMLARLSKFMSKQK